ncbi:MAG: alpha/beta hydrolase [Oscillospiraceae bacterium]|jgi:pimeloyl-ACP methyl ester carboxylesterase|nr:alpha/beta hydrolase [Oscillospiraceae bacterium]
MINFLELNHSAERSVLILEGWGTSTLQYSALAKHLSAKYRVLVPDFPGQGATPEPAESMSCADYVTWVNGFAEERGLTDGTPVTLIGHSHGGRVILKAAGRFAFPVEKIALIDSAGIVPPRIPLKLSYRIARTLLKPFPKLLDAYKSKRGSADYRAASPVMRDTLVKVVNEDMRGRLREITVPTLLIWGENDTATPLSDAKLMAAQIADCGLVTVAGAGHYAHLDNPALVYSVIDSFLDGGLLEETSE